MSDALKQLAKRQAVRQYCARLPLKIESNKWMQPVENTDNSDSAGDNLGVNRVTSSSERIKTGADRMIGRKDRVTTQSSCNSQRKANSYRTLLKSGDNQSECSNTWNIGLTVDNNCAGEVHESTGDNRTRNALVQNDLDVTSKPTHTRETFDCGKPRMKHANAVISMDNEGPSIVKNVPSSVIKIPCGDDCKDRASTGDTIDKLGSARQDYNNHMQMLIERLAAHKFSNGTMEAVVPKPPTRPRSAKRPVSAQRISR